MKEKGLELAHAALASLKELSDLVLKHRRPKMDKEKLEKSTTTSGRPPEPGLEDWDDGSDTIVGS